jgi:signal transduction histidine kinase
MSATTITTQAASSVPHAARRDPPSRVLGVAVALSALAVFSCINLALIQPSLNLGQGERRAGPLATSGKQVVALGLPDAPPLQLEPGDGASEPDSPIGDYASFNRFFDRQQQLSELLRAPDLQLYHADGTVTRVVPAPRRSLASLPFIFWLQLVSAVGCWLTGAAIWAFRRDQPAAGCCAMAGFSALLMIASAAVYSSRELALPGTLFRWLSSINHGGALFSSASFIAVLWYYPRPLGRARPGPWIMAAALLIWALDRMQWLPAGNRGVQAACVGGYLVSAGLAALQWRAGRGDPLRRAALQWFLLSWFVGSGAFLMLVSVPALVGIDSGEIQAYAFACLLLISGGLALGIARFRLFDLETWWFRAILLVLGGFLVLVFDVLLVAVMRFEAPVALAVSLMLAGWLYFPIRQWLTLRFVTGARQLRVDDVPGLLRDVLAPNAYATNQLLPEALRRLFRPLDLHPLSEPQPVARIADNGLALRVPGIGAHAAWEARYPDDGHRLFSRRDIEVVAAVRAVLDRVAAYQIALEHSVEVERARVAQDLHDDIGARLLTLLHRSEGETARQVREVLANLRLAVHGLGASRQPLADALATWRAEAAERCEASGVQLQWHCCAAPQVVLEAPQLLDLARAVREAVSNALRHAQPSYVGIAVALSEQALELCVENDGVQTPPEQWRPGFGLRGMRSRVQRLGGYLEITALDGGRCQLCLRLPLATCSSPRLGGDVQAAQVQTESQTTQVLEHRSIHAARAGS